MVFRSDALVVLLALVFVACGPTRESLLLDTQQVPADRVIQAVQSADHRGALFSGEGSVAFESSDMSGSVFFSIAMHRPDSLLIRLEGPFGIDVGFLFANRAHIVLYNAMENWYLDEPTGNAGMRKALPVDLPFDQMIDAFAGSFRLPTAGRPFSYAIDDEKFLLKYRQGTEIASYWVDPSLHIVTRYQLVRGDSILAEAAADRFTEDGDCLVPRSITLTIPSLSQSISIFYSNLEAHPSEVSFARTIPLRAFRRTFR
jgi:outer membrane biogenesis lipoprotein LolB